MSRGGGALRLLGGTTLFGLAMCVFTPLPNAACRRAAVTGTPRPAQAIVVLGADMTREGLLSASSLRRLPKPRKSASEKLHTSSHDDATTPIAIAPATSRSTNPLAIEMTSAMATVLTRAL